MHINANIGRPGFAEIVLGKFRAVVQNDNVDKIREYLSLSPRAMVSKAARYRGEKAWVSRTDIRGKPSLAVREGIAAWTRGGLSHWQIWVGNDRLDTAVESKRPRLELLQKVVSCPMSETWFWAYCWGYASARDGLHVFIDDSEEG